MAPAARPDPAGREAIAQAVGVIGPGETFTVTASPPGMRYQGNLFAGSARLYTRFPFRAWNPGSSITWLDT
jgi:hypothetical protein